MSFFSQFAGSPSPTSIVNGYSNSSAIANFTGVGNIGRFYDSGALTANTLSTILNVTTAGVVYFVGAYTVDATLRDLRLKITLDGNSVFDRTGFAISTTSRGLVAVGFFEYTSLGDAPVYQPITFNSSMKIEIASNLSETDKFKIIVNYITAA